MRPLTGKVVYWNFLPPKELNKILSLYTRVTNKTLLISMTFGIEGRKLLTPEDDYDALREFNASYEGTRSRAEEMHLEYQKLMKQHPELANRLDMMPGSVFSGRRRLAKGSHGVFFCYALPALDKQQGDFTLEADQLAGTSTMSTEMRSSCRRGISSRVFVRDPGHHAGAQ